MASSDSLDEAKRLLKPAIERTEFRVFVFGPALEPAQIVSCPTSTANSHEAVADYATYLRYSTKQRLEDRGFTVDYGETPAVLDFWQKFFRSNAAATEMSHANKACGAVIIFPATFGSMAELALFALKASIAEKTLAIVHQDYESAESFFRRGLLELFETYNGKVKYLDYTKTEACVRHAERYVEGKYWKVCQDVDDYREIKSRHHGKVFQHALESSTN
jgi:hypothetical protein